MKSVITLLIALCTLICITLVDASKSHFATFNPSPIHFEIPKGWPKPNNDLFKNNPLTEEGFELGRKLFYDGRLSKDGKFSCNTCHQQFAAFSNFDHDLSHGFNNSFTTRNAPALINLAWMDKLHWDGGINNLEVQPLAPMTSATEMGESLESVLKKLNGDSIYKKMFKAAFGKDEVSSQMMLKALAQFTGSLVSCNSKYDKVKSGYEKFTISEENGYQIFKANCSACHTEPLFTDNSFRNNGLAMNEGHDIGRMKITGKRSDSLKFKVPTLRNAYYTFPFMHDGRLSRLENVVDHYVNEIVKSPTLDPILNKPMHINEGEKKDLIAFIHTLTDTSFLKNPRFARFN